MDKMLLFAPFCDIGVCMDSTTLATMDITEMFGRGFEDWSQPITPKCSTPIDSSHESLCTLLQFLLDIFLHK